MFAQILEEGIVHFLGPAGTTDHGGCTGFKKLECRFRWVQLHDLESIRGITEEIESATCGPEEWVDKAEQGFRSGVEGSVQNGGDRRAGVDPKCQWI